MVDPEDLEGQSPVAAALHVPVHTAAEFVAATERAVDERGAGEGFELGGWHEVAGLKQPALNEDSAVVRPATGLLEAVEPAQEILARDAQAAVLDRGIDCPELHARRNELDARPQRARSEQGRTVREPQDRVFGVGQSSHVDSEALVRLMRKGQVGADPRARRLMILDVRRPRTKVAPRLPPDGSAEGRRRPDAFDTLAEPIQRVRQHRDVMDILDRFTLRPDAWADVGTEERRRHEALGAERVTERFVPLPRARHEPVADPQVEGIIEPVVDPSQVNRVVECGRREEKRRELKPRIESEARELDEVTIDLDGPVIADRLPRSGAVDPRVRASREAGEPSLGEQVDPQLERNPLRIAGPDQDEHASIFVVAADQ